LSKVAYFNLPHLHFVTPLQLTPFEFRGDFVIRKLPVLRCLRYSTLSRFEKIPACGRQTDTRRQHIPR